MKLAFCLFKYFPFGGLQRDFLRIAHECRQRGHTVDIFTTEWEGEKDPTLPVHIIPVKGLQNHTRNCNFAQQLQTLLTPSLYDLRVGFNKMPGLDVYYAADTCFQAKARQQRGAWYRFSPRYRQLTAFEQAVFAADAKTMILLLSKQQQADFMHYYQTPLHRFHLLPPGITQDRIAPDNAPLIKAELRRELAMSPQEFLLLMVGSGFKTKGLDRILLGMHHLPDNIKNRTRLVIIGKDHASPFYRQAQQLGIANQVYFLGGRDDVPRFLLAADALLHPAYNENTGTVLLEALTSGLPVLTTDVCGYAGYIRDVNAGIVLSSPFQQEQFNQALCDILLSPHRPLWRENALAFAKQADIYSMPQRAVSILESLRAEV